MAVAYASDQETLLRYKNSMDDRYHVPVLIREMMLARILDWKLRVDASWCDVKMVANNLGVDDADTIHNMYARLLEMLKERNGNAKVHRLRAEM